MSRIALALGLLPFAVGVAVLLAVGDDLHLSQDIAQMEMRIRDVGRHEVLLGPYSRDGWYHPGPAVFYLLALPYRLTGGASVGLHLGALVVNAASVAGMALIARRRGGVALMAITLLAVGLLVRSLGADFVRDPWNPSITVLPFGLMVFLAWAMTCRELWALPVGAVVASFLAQTHVGYVALALPLLAWGAAWIAVPAARQLWTAWRSRLPDGTDSGGPGPERRGGWRHRWSRTTRWLIDQMRGDLRGATRAGLATAALLAVLWAPPLVEQVTGSDGNLGAIATYFRHSEEPPHSLADGWRVLSTQWSVTPDWVTGTTSTALSGEPMALYSGLIVPVLLIPLGFAMALLWRRGGADARALVTTLAFAVVLGIVAVARTTGIAFTYRLQWVQVLGMTMGVAMAWAAWLALLPRLASRTSQGLAAVAGIAVLAVLAATNGVAAARAGTPLEQQSDAIAALLPEILDRVQAGDNVTSGTDSADGMTAGTEGAPVGPVLVSPTSFGSLLFTTGIALALERSAVDARMPAITEAAGAHRTLEGNEPAVTLVVVVNEDIPDRLEDPDLELVALWGTPPEPREDDDPVAAAEAAFAAGDIETMKDLGRLYLDGNLPEPFSIQAVAVFLD